MRVIHGIWAHGALRVWGEVPELPPAAACSGASPRAAPVRLPGRRAGRPAGRAARAGRPGGGPQAADGELVLRLPSAAGRPGRWPRRTSSGRAPWQPAGRRRGPESLAGWRVPALVLAPAAALDLLRAAAPLGELAIPGSSMPYLSALAASLRPWPPAAGCCPSWPPKTAATPRGGARCSAARTRSARVTWPRRCRRRAGPPADRLPRSCWPTRWTASPTRRRGLACRFPAAREARPYAGPHSFGRTIRGRTDQH